MAFQTRKFHVLNTVKEVEVDKEFIVAVFWNDEEDQRSKEELADRHFEATLRHLVT